jgi:16S rRNA (adenine1518-N6/adenine1519-N6)-dimethyltransferase
MLTKNDIKFLEKKYKFFPQKKLGQNFLIDINIKNKLLRHIEVCIDVILVEIGSGLGQLTFDLAKIAKKVIAIELDKKLFSILSDLAKDFTNVVLVHEDFLKVNLREFFYKSKKIKVVSNLPYYISTPVILKLFAYHEYIQSATLTLQKEVANRLIAKPNTKEYGSLSLFTEFHSEVKKLFDISRNSFYPIPKVDSTVIYLRMRAVPPVQVNDKKHLFELIRTGFSTRRKTLLNALLSQNYKNLPRDQLEKAIAASGISYTARAEMLCVSDFAKLANSI